MKTKKLTVLALFTALALILSLIDSMLPPPVPVPGIKLGLSNIVILLVLLRYEKRDAVIVMIAKILLASFFAGQFSSFFYSLAGGILSLLIMLCFLKLFGNRLIPLTSIAGAVFHNLGQFAVALFLLRTAGLLAYLPFLMISGIVTGLFIGLCCHAVHKYMPSLTF